MNTKNSVGFSWHAMDRVVNRLSNVIDYAKVKTVLETKPFRNGPNQTVVITTLDRVVTVKDETLLNGYARGNKIVADVDVMDNGTSVFIKTVKLVDTHSKYR